jgi:hypothetical protein
LKKSIYAPTDALTLLAGRKPPSWAKAVAAAESVLQRSRAIPRVSEACVALENLERAYRDQVLHPLRAADGKTGVHAQCSMMAADFARIWVEDLDVVQALRRLLVGQFPGYLQRIDDDALDRKLRISSAVVKLTRT